jgi:hypothetical protein
MRYQYQPTVKKVPAESVPYGTDICTRGNSVWAAYSGEELVVVAATKKEVLRKYRSARNRMLMNCVPG